MSLRSHLVRFVSPLGLKESENKKEHQMGILIDTRALHRNEKTESKRQDGI